MRLDIWNDPPLQNHSTRYDMRIMEILREIFWLKREHFTDLISDLQCCMPKRDAEFAK